MFFCPESPLNQPSNQQTNKPTTDPPPPPLRAGITYTRYFSTPLPCLDLVTQFNPDTLTWGGLAAPSSIDINLTLASPTSPSSDLSQHPGFSVHPVAWCSSTPNGLTPMPVALYIVSTPSGLADALVGIAANVSSSPAAVAAMRTVFPATVSIGQGTSISDVVQLAASQNRSIGVGVPLLLMPSIYPLQYGAPPPPSPVVLDLSGCIGCVSLMGQARVYLTNLHLTGLQRPGPGSSSSNGDGGHLSSPLWAFQFNRSSGATSITLYNVTLTLPQVCHTTQPKGLPKDLCCFKSF